MKRQSLNLALAELDCIRDQHIFGLISDCEYLIKVVDLVERINQEELFAENKEEVERCDKLLRMERPDLYTEGDN